jgi:hypothetical protein
MSDLTPERVVAEAIAVSDPPTRLEVALAQTAVAALREAGMLGEPEWEYGVRNEYTGKVGHPFDYDQVTEMSFGSGLFKPVCRTKAGAWLEVPSE